MPEPSLTLRALLNDAVDRADEYALPRTMATAGLVVAVQRWLAQPDTVATVRELVGSVAVLDMPDTRAARAAMEEASGRGLKPVTAETLIHTLVLRLCEAAAGTACPRDTDGDGSCGRRGCPHCHPDPDRTTP